MQSVTQLIHSDKDLIYAAQFLKSFLHPVRALFLYTCAHCCMQVYEGPSTFHWQPAAHDDDDENIWASAPEARMQFPIACIQDSNHTAIASKMSINTQHLTSQERLGCRSID